MRNTQPCERLIHPSSAPARGRTPTVSGVLCNPPSTRMHSPKTPVAAHANESNTPSCTPHKQSESRPMAKHADMLAAPGCIPSRPEGITAFGADGSPESDRKKMQGALTYRLAGIHGANGRHLHRWPGQACGKCHHAGLRIRTRTCGIVHSWRPCRCPWQNSPQWPSMDPPPGSPAVLESSEFSAGSTCSSPPQCFRLRLARWPVRECPRFLIEIRLTTPPKTLTVKR